MSGPNSPTLASSIFGRRGGDENYVWQDREIRFDAPLSDLECRTGESILDDLDQVEDTKGNNGEPGELFVTNLRLIWTSKKSRRTNISLGYNCITALNIRNANSRLKGQTQALFVLTKFNGQRFEFIYTNLIKAATRLFTTVQAVFRAYDTSRLYRDLKLRGAIIQEKELRLLPQEQTYSRVNGVWNLSSEQGNLGTFFITNVRVVWYANLAESFNVSIPYLQIKSVRVRESKFGPALVVETTQRSGGYILGFKIDPKETLDYVFKEISSLWQVFSSSPVFGVFCNVEDNGYMPPRISSNEEDVEIVDAGDKGDLVAQYYADTSKASDREPQYCAELGLAVEQLKDGVTIDLLWNVL